MARDGRQGDWPPADPVAIPIEDWIDLHTFDPREIPALVDDYVNEAARRGFAQVRIIHGKGKGIQRETVRRALTSHPKVVRFADAPPQAGGWGATLAWLTPDPEVPS